MSSFPEDQDLTFPDDGGCFGCSGSNTDGLRMRFRRQGETVYADYAIPEKFHGAPGIAHGGIVATMLDEVSCAWAVFVGDQRVVTGELSIRYRQPCPVAIPVRLEAHLTDRNPRYFVVEARVSKDGVLLAHSTGKFFFLKQ